jgi:hypothetical protein
LKELPNPNKLKIIGGKAKGLRIDSPDVYLRPMMAKVSKSTTSRSHTNMCKGQRGHLQYYDSFRIF